MSLNILFAFALILIISLFSKRWGLIFCILSVLWLLSHRTEDIPDTANYIIMYETPLLRMEYDELGFLFLGIIFNYLTHLDFLLYYLFLISLCFLLWYYYINKLLYNGQLCACFLLFISFYGFFYLGVTTRNAISELLLLGAFYYYLNTDNKKRWFLYLLFVVLAFLMHKSAILFLVLLPFIRANYSTKSLFYIYFVSLFLWIVSGIEVARSLLNEFSDIPLFSSKIEKYASSIEASPNMFSLQILINLIISFVAINQKKYIVNDYCKVYNFFLNINLIGLLTMTILWSLPTSYRFYNMFFFYNFIIMYLIIYQNKRYMSKMQKKMLTVLTSSLYFFILIYSNSFMLLF